MGLVGGQGGSSPLKKRPNPLSKRSEETKGFTFHMERWQRDSLYLKDRDNAWHWHGDMIWS
jgi:hypothetical protein